MAESVQDPGLSGAMSELTKEHGGAVGSRRANKAKPGDVVTQFRGVSCKPSGRYKAQIWVPSLRGNICLGTFDTAEEAAKVYDAAAVELRACTPAKAAAAAVELHACLPGWPAKKKRAAAVELHACLPGWAGTKKRPAARPDPWTEFRGVHRTPSGRYAAQIRGLSGGKARTWLGTFDAAEDAARAYDDAAVKLHGAMAVTNFKRTREDRDAASTAMTAKKKKKAARPDARTKFRGVYRTVSGNYGAQICSKTKASRTWLGTFGSVEEAARAYDAAAVRLHGAAAKTNLEQPPTGAAAAGGEESPMDLLNDFPEVPALDFLSHSLVSGAQHDDLWADLPPAERQLGDEFIKDTDFSDVVP